MLKFDLWRQFVFIKIFLYLQSAADFKIVAFLKTKVPKGFFCSNIVEEPFLVPQITIFLLVFHIFHIFFISETICIVKSANKCELKCECINYAL